MPIYHAKDNSFKQILGNNQLFAEFLKDFIPLFEEARDSDSVKRVNSRI